MGEECSRNFIRVLAVLLLTVWTICTMASGHILGSLGFDTAFEADGCILPFKEKLLNCIKFFMAALTIAAFASSGVTWSVLFIISKMELFIRKCLTRKKFNKSQPEALTTLISSVGDKSTDSNHDIVQRDCQEKGRRAAHLRQPCAGTFAAIFSATLVGSLSVTSSVLAVRLKSEDIEGEFLRYVISDISAGVFFPLLYLTAVVIMTAVMDHWTGYALKCYTLLAAMLPGVKFVEVGENGGYWMFSDSFVIGKNYNLDPKEQNCKAKTFEPQKYCLVNNNTLVLSSVLLAILFVLNKTFSFSYFVDISFIFQTTLHESCSGFKYMLFSCFDSDTFKYVSCDSPDIANATLYCYRFNLNFQSANIVLAILSSCGLHVGLLCLLVDFTFMMGKLQKFFQHLGLTVAFLGIVLLFVTVSMFVIRQTSTSHTAKFLHSYLNVLHFVQLAIICMDLTVIGLLVQKGKPMKSNVLADESDQKGTLETLV